MAAVCPQLRKLRVERAPHCPLTGKLTLQLFDPHAGRRDAAASPAASAASHDAATTPFDARISDNREVCRSRCTITSCRRSNAKSR
jgi:hypothetical protein